jgi:methionyl aminopeptidase
MIVIKSPREIDLIHKSCQLVVESFNVVEKLIKPGVRTIELDKAVADFIYSKGGRPAFKGFKGYPANICVSIDEQVVHGIPCEQCLIVGQIVSVDIGVELNSYYGDAAKTYPVGEISVEKKRLLDVTKQSLYMGIEQAKELNRLSDVSHAIQSYVEKAGYSVVRELVGHGVGRQLHEEPQIPNYGKPHQGPRLRAGMVLAIEPMVNCGIDEVITADDNWTVSTKDGLPSAHFEHTVAITKNGPVILTK